MRAWLILFLAVLLPTMGCNKETHSGGNQEYTYLAIEDSTRATDVSWSPNGSRLAYSTGREIKYVTLPTPQGTKVAESSTGILTTPSWSPSDPARIAYVKIDSVAGTATVLESDTLGANLDTIFTYTRGQLGVGFVSPDSLCLDLVRPAYGNRIYISAVGNRPGVWAIDTTLGTISFFLEGRWPDVEPDGTYMAYASSNGGIRIRDLDSLTTDSISANGLYPSWSPDGDQVAYCHAETLSIWSRTTAQLRGSLMSENVTNIAWRRPPNVYDIAMRAESDGTVWIFSTLLIETTSRATPFE
jgi:Tol biopolymer transport system component